MKRYCTVSLLLLLIVPSGNCDRKQEFANLDRLIQNAVNKGELINGVLKLEHPVSRGNVGLVWKGFV